MRGGRILWGQIAVVFTIVLVMVWAATQWTAFRLGFQPQLGAPWFELAGLPVHYPPAFFWWWFSFDAYAPAIFVEGGIIAVSGGFLAIAAAIFMSIIRAREARNVATYGSARWAEGKEIHAAGLLGPDGVLLGRYDRDYLRHDGPEHVLCFAPTRSGKGVGLVVPTLLTWPASAIVHDIKGENWTLTAGFRAKHGRVLLFDPTNARSSAYNPLLEVRQGEWEFRAHVTLCMVMRKLLAILCSAIVLASLFEEARSDHALHESPFLETHAMPMVQESHCGGGSGHVACQVLLASQLAAPILKIAFASSQFEIVPVRASSRISSPQPPPPRYVS